jgi:iron complex outermembrane receptor protein
MALDDGRAARVRAGAVGAAVMLALHAVPALAASGTVTLSALKQLNVEDLMNVEVTSVTKHPERLLGAASAIQVITQAEIRRSGAATLAEALRLADNLQTAQRDAHSWAISARGFNTDLANKLLVLIDGRSVYTPLFSGVFWDAQDYLLEDIDRIEVISGPGGTQWGANAVNGVINIITRKAADTQGLYAEAGGGSELQDFAGLRYGGSLAPDVHFRAYGKYFERDDSVLASGAATRDAWTRSQGGFRLDSTSVADNALTLQGDFYDLDHQVPLGGSTTMRGANLLGRWTRRISDASDWSLQTYYDRTKLAQAVAPLRLGGVPFTPAGTLRDDLTTLDLDFQHRLPLGTSHGLTWGLGFRYTHDDVDNAPAIAFLPARLSHSLYSAFLQDEILLRTGLSLTVGTKVEHNDYTGLEVEPSLRLQWEPAVNQTVWGAVSRAVRTPSRIDRDLFQAAPPYFALLQGRSDFKSEKVVAYEVGHRAQVLSLLTTSLAAFYNEYRDVRSTSITPVTLLPFYFANNLDGQSYGLEFTGSLQLRERWSLHAGYTLLKSHLRVKPGQFDLSNARNETSDPENQLSLRSSVNLPGSIELDAGLRWVDTLQNSNGPNAGTVPSYIEMDARVAWHATGRLELSVVGQNLLHDHHPEYGFPSAIRPEIERGVYGKLAWRR